VKTDALGTELDRIAALTGVRVVVASGMHEGLVVHAAGEDARDAEAAAALFSSVFRRAAAVALHAGRGEPRLIRVQSGGDEVLAVGAGSMVLTVVARRGANVGRVRLELLRAAGAVT
jgi:predicted regulator of Ras-like GTPase activity (Roadblock/LC7/MglB family)